MEGIKGNVCYLYLTFKGGPMYYCLISRCITYFLSYVQENKYIFTANIFAIGILGIYVLIEVNLIFSIYHITVISVHLNFKYSYYV